jgi:hypothetical protein
VFPLVTGTGSPLTKTSGSAIPGLLIAAILTLRPNQPQKLHPRPSQLAIGEGSPDPGASFYGVPERLQGGKLGHGISDDGRRDLHVQFPLFRVALLPRGRDHRAVKGGTEGAAGVVDDPA